MSDSFVKYIAIHTCLFNRIPENDEWWGEGFTEWWNVKSGKPLFDGHNQPRVPHKDIGYYDLSEPEVLIRQTEMAKKYGIYGWCFYFSWIDGRRLFEKPLENVLKTPEINMPFFVCWTNHDWTRNWGAASKELLLKQTYAPDFYKRLIDDLMPYFSDSRYIKINGKPILSIYIPQNIPDPKNFASKIKEYARKTYNIDLYLMATDNIDYRFDAKSNGYDALYQHSPTWNPIESVSSSDMPNFYEPMECRCLDYRTLAVQDLLRDEDDVPLYQDVFMEWDNSCRRGKNNPIILRHATNKNFEIFLTEMSKKAMSRLAPEQRFVFIDAWDEWGEGTYLEPDEKDGYARLEIVKKLHDMSAEELNNTDNGATLWSWLNISIRNRKEYLNSIGDVNTIPNQKRIKKPEGELFHLKMKLWKDIKLFFQIIRK